MHSCEKQKLYFEHHDQIELYIFNKTSSQEMWLLINVLV